MDRQFFLPADPLPAPQPLHDPSAADISRIAAHLNLTEDEFIQGHTRLDAQRSGLALRDHADGSCGFLDGRGNCRIQPVKPRQCSDFPNRWNFPGFEAICRARPVEVSAEEWERRVAAPPPPFKPRSARGLPHGG